MKIEFRTVAAFALLTGSVLGKAPGRLRRKTKAAPSRAVQVHRKLSNLEAYPIQTFFVPLPEVDLFQNTFESINRAKADPPVISLISFAISTTGTVIWYDHWEDGYEEDVRNPAPGSTTQVWGDGDSSNGCHPNVSSCTDSNDRFLAGDSVVIQNTVQIGTNASPSRDKNQIYFDGADRIQSSFPIAVTRAAYPQNPGSLMAGGVEVLDTSLWGKSFKAPVGQDTDFETDGFQYSALYVMAGEDDTKVYIKGSSSPTTLSMGESIHVLVNQGDTVTSDKYVQVDLLTGDIDSDYELRWYSLRATENWSDKYLSPVGDSVGETKLVIYNPNTFAINVKITVNNGDVTNNISGGEKLVSETINTGSAALLEETSGHNFIVLSVTDTVGSGRLFDWGFPVVAVRDLTPQVLIGLGFGCTDNECLQESFNDKETRSVVWVSPVEDADIYVDYQNDGIVDSTYQVNYLDSQVILDETDKDMSGAVIFATRKGSGPTGTQVNFAAAWGQDPSRSGSSDESALDLGTMVVPFNGFQASKIVQLVDDKDNNGEISPGDKIMYTIVVSNVGQQDIPTGRVTIKDNLDPAVTYVADSMRYEVPETGESTLISGSSFPLAGDGLSSQFSFLKRGGTHEISFEVVINDAEFIVKDAIFNNGSISFGGAVVTYSLDTPLGFEANIDIEKTVYMGHNGKVSCNGEELVTGEMDDLITYCFEVTNNGPTFLKNVSVTDSVLGFSTNSIGVLAPGQTETVFMQTTLTRDVTSDAEATGIPVYPDGETELPGLDIVRAEDPAGVELRFEANIDIEKTVYMGHNGKVSCNGEELVTGEMNDFITYCFEVTNNGPTFLKNVSVTDSVLGFSTNSIGVLAPGQTETVFMQTTLTRDVTSDAEATGIPVYPDGETELPGLDIVRAEDPAGVKLLVSEKNEVLEEDEEDYLCL